MFKVSLINPPERVLDGSYRYYLPFPLLYLASHLEENNIKTDIIDVKVEKTYLDIIKNRIFSTDPYQLTIDKIIAETRASGPSLIGISCITREYKSVMRIASLLKEKLKVPIVVGGIHPSLYPQHFIYERSPVDFAVIGEGEETLLELARFLESGREDYEHIDGIAYLKKVNLYQTGLRAINNNFSISPINVYHKLNMDFYTRPHAYITRHVRISGVQIFTSRGCPYRCTFCSNSIISMMNKRKALVRFRPIKDVVEEIRFLRDQYHIDGFYIMDDTFCLEKRHVQDFCSELENAGLSLVWAAETRSNLIDEPLLKKMKQAGLVQLDIGVESGSDEMLKELQKGITVKETLNIFALAHKHKIRAFASVMVNLPNETLGQLQETIGLLEKIRPASGVIGTTTPLPKTELFNKYFAPKLKSEEEITELFSWQSDNFKPGDERFHLSRYNLDLQKLINRLIVKHFFFAELQLRLWYWKVFFKSKRKPQYLFSIVQGFINITERLITRS